LSFKSPALTVLAVMAALAAGAYALAAPAASPAPADCSKCHASLTVRKKTVHAAVTMGCPSCHSGIANALKVPHVKSGTIAKGLGSEQPDLCYGCHDKTKFTKKTVHAAVGMGCTGCHDPHAGNNEKLLTAPVPDLCVNCHDKAEFSRKNVHAAVQMGCLTCHDPHSADNPGLLIKSAYELCLGCHEQVNKSPHAISGFGNAGHPLGGSRKKKSGKEPARDPKREGRMFSCASCHNPHSSDSIKLFRYPAKTSMDLCTYCHKF
jgi:predicted CXXCH cytochrome family protein